MWPNTQETADLVTFTEKILDGKLHFLCSAKKYSYSAINIWSKGNIAINIDLPQPDLEITIMPF